MKLEHTGGSWVDELPSIQWSYQTTPRKEIGMPPFHLMYGGEACIHLFGLESPPNYSIVRDRVT